MTLVVIDPPKQGIVSLDELKPHLRVEGDEEDAYLNGLISAASAWIDGPDGWLGRSIAVQTLELRLDTLCGDAILLPFGPALEIESVRYIDAAGAEQTVAPSAYELTGRVLGTALGQSWPAYRSGRGAVRVRYVAGYGKKNDDGEYETAAPAPIKQAILLLIGQWYSFRENVSTEKPGELPFAVEALLAPYRVWS